MSSSMKQITVTAGKKPSGEKAKGGKKGKLRHMTVTPMANGGATVEHHFMPADNTEYGMSPASETHGFSKAKDAGKHVATMLEGMPGPGANAQIDGSTNGAPAANEN